MKTNKIKLINIAKKCGVTHSAVSCWFNGVNSPNIRQIEIMDKSFDIPAKAWYDIRSYVLNNSTKFGAIKILREQHNGNTEV